MRKEGDKRGLSNIVATLIIILLVLVAIAIIWVVIRAFIERSTDEITLSKFTIDLKIDSARTTNESVNVKVIRNPGEGKLKGITFLIFDGLNTKVIEKKGENFSLEQLEKKTFILDYTGPITKISIAPMFETNSGKIITGSITDVYYFISFGSGTGNCTPDCGTRQCGPVPNGCGISCGACIEPTPYCDNGVCTETPCTPGCSCAQEICMNETCIGGCGESCQGELLSDCGEYECGAPPNGCGDCGGCEDGYHCDNGICVVSCISDCGDFNCGEVPNGCGENCGTCNATLSEWCDSSLGPGEAGYCTNETACESDCGYRNCGVIDQCGDSCGSCNESLGEWCGPDYICTNESYLNNGTVNSTWPINIGYYFNTRDIPIDSEDYNGMYVKFTTGAETRCLLIAMMRKPIVPEIYNMTDIEVSTVYTDIQAGDSYQIWETYAGCIK